MEFAYDDEVTGAELDKPGHFKVRLASCGNADFGENPNAPVPGLKTQDVKIRSLREAAARVSQYVAENALICGNWAGGHVTSHGEIVAIISYNGRVWRIKDQHRPENVKSTVSIRALLSS